MQNYASGMFFNKPHENAPTFVLGSISIRPDVFIEWLKEQKPNEKGYVRLQVKEGEKGKPYVSLDTWQKTQPRASSESTEDVEDTIDLSSIPF